MGQGRNDITASVARAAGRLTGDKELRKRLVLAGASGVWATLTSVGRVLRTLWHEITGFLFICLAVIGAAQVARNWNEHQTGKLAVAAVFSGLFLYFGVSSFWISRRAKSTTHTRRTRRKA